jgi:hypothetical protein
MAQGSDLGRLWDWVRGWAVQNAAHYVYTPVPRQPADPEDGAPLAPQASYLRIWLSEMYLGRSRAWGKAWFPAVHAEIQLRFGDLEAATFSRVIRPPEATLAKGVRLNYPLTELLPYNGGVVEVEAALLALQGSDYLAAAIGILQGFSSLVVPPLGQALGVAAKVSSGARDLLGGADGQVHLGFHDAFVSGGGGHLLAPGYLAVVLATAEQVRPERLSVIDGQLRYTAPGDNQAKPLEGHDYLLFRIEGRTERDDWRLRTIDEPLHQAIVALSQGESSKAQAYRMVALAAAWQSPDLAARDRRRVVSAIKEELGQIENEGFGATGQEARSLDAIMASRAMPTARAAALGELSADEVFAR